MKTKNLLIPLFALSMCGFAAGVKAEIFTVVNVSDGGPGSFRQAIIDANTMPGPDEIVFAFESSSYAIIELESPLPPIEDTVAIDASKNSSTCVDEALKIALARSPFWMDIEHGLKFVEGSDFSSVRGLAISGFSHSGIRVENVSNIQVSCNYLGLGPEGLAPVFYGTTQRYGISGSGAKLISIGGYGDADRNVIAGNLDAQIYLDRSREVLISRNYIGLDSSGEPLSDNGYGIHFDDVIFTDIRDNRISGNREYGIYLAPIFFQSGINIEGNYIGTDVDGGSQVGWNQNYGIYAVDVVDLKVGGDGESQRNVVGGNPEAGIFLDNARGLVAGNYIGVDASGVGRLEGSGPGIILGRAPGDLAIESNVISGNRDYGILFQPDFQQVLVTVAGNIIGLAPDGVTVFDNEPQMFGIFIDNADVITIGGHEEGRGNIITDNRSRGIFLNRVYRSRVSGNFIGVAADESPGHHSGGGIKVENSTSNVIDDHNVIAFNGGSGISVTGASYGISILGNSIFENEGLGIDLGEDGLTYNDGLDGDTDSGPNLLINYPDLLQVLKGGNQLDIAFYLETGFLGRYRVEFFTGGEDPSGAGEGRIFLGARDVEQTFPGDLHVVHLTIPDGLDPQFVSATTTAVISGRTSSTSEFSFSKEVVARTLRDFGDAPDTGDARTGPGDYHTRDGNDGPSHLIDPMIRLGKCIDGELDALPNSNAIGDDDSYGIWLLGDFCETGGDDEDGLNYITTLWRGDLAKMEVSVMGEGYLNVWIDWNQNGVWERDEQVVADAVPQDGRYVKKLDVPEHASLGETYMRMRYSYEQGLKPTGPAESGEVEDYRVKVEEGGGVFDPVIKRTQPEPWTPVKTETKGTSIKR